MPLYMFPLADKVLDAPDDIIGPGWDEGSTGGTTRDFYLGEPDVSQYYTKQRICQVCGKTVSNEATYCRACAMKIEAFKRRVVAAARRRDRVHL